MRVEYRTDGSEVSARGIGRGVPENFERNNQDVESETDER